jgi:CBS domain-containing protein
VPGEPSAPAAQLLGTPGASSPGVDAQEEKVVAQVMRRRFIALAPGDALLEAELLMRMARVRFLPVAVGGALVGGLSHRALLVAALAKKLPGRRSQALASWLRETPVARIMGSPVSVTPGTSLGEAVARLLDKGDGCLSVVEPGAGGKRLVGLVTASDLLRAAFGFPR